MLKMHAVDGLVLGIRLKISVGKCTKEFAKKSLPEKSKGICKKKEGRGEGVDKILSTFLKVFSQAAISYGYFPKWQLPKRAFSQAVAALESTRHLSYSFYLYTLKKIEISVIFSLLKNTLQLASYNLKQHF